MIITPEQFDAAYEKLPFPIRSYIADDELGAITQEVGKEYGLHIDTVGGLEREILNMLLGLINPEQFVGELRSMGVPQENIGAIVKELNAKVFMPLRENMMNAPKEGAREPEIPTVVQPNTFVSAPVAPAPPAVAVPPAPAYTPPPAPVYTSVPVYQAIPTLPPLVPPKPAYVPPPIPAAAPVTAAPISISSTNPQLQPPPFSPVVDNVHMPARTMSQDMSTVQGVQKTSAPQQSENKDALHAVLKGYGVDPYREPAA